MFKDDVSHLSMDGKGQYLVVSDDNGDIHVIDVGEGAGTIKRLHGGHSSSGCSMALMKPSSESGSNQLVSGGLDSSLISWDVDSASPLYRLDMNTVTRTRRNKKDPADKSEEDDEGEVDYTGMEFVNPAYVHCLGFGSEGSYVCCGLGNGSIEVFQYVVKKKANKKKGKSLQLSHCASLCSGHVSSIGAIHIPSPSFSSSLGHIIISGANDSRIALWNHHDTTHFDFRDRPKLIYNFNAKINCLHSSGSAANTIFVASVRRSLTELVIPS